MKLDSFLEIENQYGLVQDEIDGFAYWTFFRCELKWDLERLIDSCDEMYVHPKYSVWEKMKARMQTIKYSIFNSRLPKGKHDVLFLNHERKVWINNHYECIYTDKIAAKYPNSVVLERPYFQKHSKPVQTHNLVYTDYIELRAMLHFYMQSVFWKRHVENIRKKIKGKISEPIQKICEAYQIEYDINCILDKMVCGYYVYQIKKKQFEKIIKKIQPKVIVEVVGYNFDCMTINEIALQYRIPTIELQHGATGVEHIPYNYARGVKVKQFAQYFFAFSQFWIEAADYPLPKERLLPIGFPYLDQRAEEIKGKISKTKPYKIIFISQPMIGERLADIAISLEQMLDKKVYQVIFKLHPGEYERWRERYPRLAKSSVTVIDNNKTDLYELFAEAKYQIGAYGSTATFEGLEFDLKTYILREGASSVLQLLCEKEMATFFDSADELAQMIIDEQKKETIKKVFWEKDALNNMKKVIDAIAAR